MQIPIEIAKLHYPASLSLWVRRVRVGPKHESFVKDPNFEEADSDVCLCKVPLLT